MAKVKYRVREYQPSENMPGSHGFYAQAVINTDITAVELAQAVIHAIADIVAEETLEGSRISLANEDG